MKTPSHFGARLQAATLGLAGSVILAATATAQTVAYSTGDLLLGFRASSGAGSETNLVVNLGPSHSFRDNPNQGALINIGSLLSATYGSNWFDRGEVSWGAVAAWNNANPTLTNPSTQNGDFSATVYATKASADFGTSTPWGSPQAFTASAVRSTATQITGFTHSGNVVNGTFAFQTAIADTNFRAAFVPATANQSWSSKTSPNADFVNLTGGVEQSFGGTGEFSYADLYRIVPAANDPSGLAGVGQSSYITTIVINENGLVTAAIPEPSAFAVLAGVAALGCVVSRRRRAV